MVKEMNKCFRVGSTDKCSQGGSSQVEKVGHNIVWLRAVEESPVEL